jgi:hypothetical protein
MNHKLRIRNGIYVAAIILIAAAPFVSFANQWWNTAAIVPCGISGKDPCTLCDLFQLASNIVNFLWLISLPLAGLMLMVGGFLILTAGDAQARRQLGIKTMQNTFWGLVIAFSAWLIVSTIINSLGGQGIVAGWHQFPSSCK